MGRLRVTHTVGAGVMLCVTWAWCAGFATNTAQPEPQKVPPEWEPSPEIRSPSDRRNVEEWAAIAAASKQAHTCLELERGPLRGFTGEKLVDLTRNIINGCFARQGASEQSEEVDALPFTYARHAPTGIPLELAYQCGCVVPSSCSVYARLQDVREDQCCGHGGAPLYNDDLGSTYGGCVPRELTTREQRMKACPARGEAPPARSRPADAYRGDD
jgi:hypothetical protein